MDYIGYYDYDLIRYCERRATPRMLKKYSLLNSYFHNDKKLNGMRMAEGNSFLAGGVTITVWIGDYF